MADGAAALPPDVRPSDRVTFLAPTRLLRLAPTLQIVEHRSSGIA